VNADHKLSGGEAVLIAEAMRFWGIDLYEVSDNSISGSGSHKGDPAKPTHVQH
jgi:hypothetical protein